MNRCADATMLRDRSERFARNGAILELLAAHRGCMEPERLRDELANARKYITLAELSYAHDVYGFSDDDIDAADDNRVAGAHKLRDALAGMTARVRHELEQRVKQADSTARQLEPLVAKLFVPLEVAAADYIAVLTRVVDRLSAMWRSGTFTEPDIAAAAAALDELDAPLSRYLAAYEAFEPRLA